MKSNRIRELAEQSIGANPTYAVATIMASPELEQFAMLIIQDCIECVDGYRKQRAFDTYYDAVEQIKANFRIK